MNLWYSACSGQAATTELFDISGDADEKGEILTSGQVAVDKIVAPKCQWKLVRSVGSWFKAITGSETVSLWELPPRTSLQQGFLMI